MADNMVENDPKPSDTEPDKGIEDSKSETPEVSSSSDSPVEVKEKSKKKKKKKRRRKSKRARKAESSSSSSGSSESSSSDESSSSSDEDRKRKKRRKSSKSSPVKDLTGMFHIQTEEEKHEYDLPRNLKDYVEHYMKKFIPDKELKESILTDNPVPKNLLRVPALDDFIKDTLKDERRNHALTMDSVLEKVQLKMRDSFGPLSRLWIFLQNATSLPADEEPIEIDLDWLLEFTQKTVLVVSQAINTVTYHRRFNALSAITSQSEAKAILKEKGEIMGEKDLLLGKDFRNQVVKDTEAKTKVTNAVRKKKKRNRTSTPTAARTDRPLRNSPPPPRRSFNKGATGGRRPPKFVYNKREKNFNKKGYNNGYNNSNYGYGNGYDW